MAAPIIFRVRSSCFMEWELTTDGTDFTDNFDDLATEDIADRHHGFHRKRRGTKRKLFGVFLGLRGGNADSLSVKSVRSVVNAGGPIIRVSNPVLIP
jgi:hypothetical protein